MWFAEDFKNLESKILLWSFTFGTLKKWNLPSNISFSKILDSYLASHDLTLHRQSTILRSPNHCGMGGYRNNYWFFCSLENIVTKWKRDGGRGREDHLWWWSIENEPPTWHVETHLLRWVTFHVLRLVNLHWQMDGRKTPCTFYWNENFKTGTQF